MAKKLNSNDRRKLLEARGRGLSNSEIKRQFGIKDDRTLRRHFQLAEREQEARAVKTEILREALRDHLAELRQLIENWKAGIRIPSVTDLPSTMTSSIEFPHSNCLFACLKDHLPFPPLWRDYNQCWPSLFRIFCTLMTIARLSKSISDTLIPISSLTLMPLRHGIRTSRASLGLVATAMSLSTCSGERYAFRSRIGVTCVILPFPFFAAYFSADNVYAHNSGILPHSAGHPTVKTRLCLSLGLICMAQLLPPKL